MFSNITSIYAFLRAVVYVRFVVLRVPRFSQQTVRCSFNRHFSRSAIFRSYAVAVDFANRLSVAYARRIAVRANTTVRFMDTRRRHCCRYHIHGGSGCLKFLALPLSSLPGVS